MLIFSVTIPQRGKKNNEKPPVFVSFYGVFAPYQQKRGQRALQNPFGLHQAFPERAPLVLVTLFLILENIDLCHL